jgi:hypothetical protein
MPPPVDLEALATKILRAGLRANCRKRDSQTAARANSRLPPDTM